MHNIERMAITRRAFVSCLLASGCFLVIPDSLQASSPIIQIRDLYNRDLSFSDLALSLENKMVEVTGFMAPPLKAESRFYVLTQRPMAVCPFCETDADWPDDIIAVYSKRIVKVAPFNIKLVTRGKLKLGSFTDPETGFASQVRLGNAVYRRKR